MSALRVGHCLLSDLAGKFEKLLTSGCLPLAWVTACFQTLQVILKSVLTFVVCSSRRSLPALRPCRYLEKRLDFLVSAFRGRSLPALRPCRYFEKCLDFLVSAFGVGHFLLSDLTGVLKSVLTS